MNQKVCENHLYVKNPSLTLANRQSYRLAQGLSKLAPNAASETRRETMVKSEEANDTTVFSRRGKAAAFSERQRRVVHALVTFQKHFGGENLLEPMSTTAGQARERAAGVERRRDATEVHRQPMPERSGGMGNQAPWFLCTK